MAVNDPVLTELRDTCDRALDAHARYEQALAEMGQLAARASRAGTTAETVLAQFARLPVANATTEQKTDADASQQTDARREGLVRTQRWYRALPITERRGRSVRDLAKQAANELNLGSESVRKHLRTLQITGPQ